MIFISGEWGIRTPGPAKQDNGFRDRPDRPLRQLSIFEVKIIKISVCQIYISVKLIFLFKSESCVEMAVNFS